MATTTGRFQQLHSTAVRTIHRAAPVALASVVILSILGGCGGGDDGSSSAGDEAVAVDSPAESATDQSGQAPAPLTIEDDPASAGETDTDGTGEQAEDAVGDNQTQGDQASGDDVADIKAMVSRYIAALEAGDGPGAADLVTPSTIDFYDQVLAAGLDADGDELLDPATPLSVAFTAVLTRAQLGEDLLTVESGRGLIELGVERDLLGDLVDPTTLGDPEINGDEAIIGLQGRPLIRFARTDGAWGIDLAFVIQQLVDVEEELGIATFTGGAADSRLEMFELFAGVYGTTWEELRGPRR